MARPKKLPPGSKWLELPSGRKVVDVYVSLGTDPTTGKRLSRHTRAGTVEEAWLIYEEARAQATAGSPRRAGQKTIGEFCAEWLAGRRSIRASTLAGYRDVFKPLRVEYGHLPLRKLTRPMLDRLITALETGHRGPLESDPARRHLPMTRADGRPRRPWKPRTVALFATVLADALDDAVRDGLIDRNVARDLELRPVPKYEAATWTPDQTLVAMEVMRGHAYELAFLLAMHGFRRGEICGMPWGAAGLDLDASTIAMAETRLLIDGEVVVSPPKSKRSRRTLPLTPVLTDAARRAKAAQTADRLKLGPAYTDSGLVARTVAGTGLNPDSLSGAWERFCRDAGVPVIRLHDARHTIATLLARTGTPPQLISAWVGHGSTAFTMATYVQDQPDALGIVADQINRLLGGQGRQA